MNIFNDDPVVPARRKRHRSVRMQEQVSSGSPAASQVQDLSTATQTPLPGTPALTDPRAGGGSVLEGVTTSPKALPAEQSEYFAAPETVPEPAAEDTPEKAAAGELAPTVATPITELPPADPPLPPTPPPVEEAPLEDAIEPEESKSPDQEQPTDEAHQDEEGAEPKELPEPEPEGSPPMIHVLPTPVLVAHGQPAFLIGLSGCSSSGKTTIAHLLPLILPPTTPWFILHLDDFFIPKHLLIPDTNGELDADCRHAIDFAAFKRMIEYAKREGRLPATFQSLQPDDEHERAVSQVPPEVLDGLRQTLSGVRALQDGRAIGIVDGFLLYHSETIRNLIDIKILLRASLEQSRHRRFQKAEYQDPEAGKYFWRTVDYFDRVVWRNHVQQHSVLFKNEDVGSKPDSKICDQVGISVQPSLDSTVEEQLRWVTRVVIRGLELGLGRDMDLDRREELEFCDCNDGYLGKLRQHLFNIL